MARKPTAHKLNEAARNLIKEKIVSGASNREIQQALDNAGYPSDLDRSTLHYYRALPEIKQALRQIAEEHTQAGLGSRARRIQFLSALAMEARNRMLLGVELPVELVDKMFGRPGGARPKPGKAMSDSDEPEEMDPDDANERARALEPVPLMPLQWAKYAELCAKLVGEITRLIDGPAGLVPFLSQSAELAEAAGGDPRMARGLTIGELTPTQRQALFNDILEAWLKREQEKAAGDETPGAAGDMLAIAPLSPLTDAHGQ